MSLFVLSAISISKNVNSYLHLVQIQLDEARTFNASFREKIFSQCPQGKSFIAKWIRLCRLRSWLRLKDYGIDHIWMAGRFITSVTLATERKGSLEVAAGEAVANLL